MLCVGVDVRRRVPGVRWTFRGARFRRAAQAVLTAIVHAERAGDAASETGSGQRPHQRFIRRTGV